jgi:hypothetical protein
MVSLMAGSFQEQGRATVTILPRKARPFQPAQVADLDVFFFAGKETSFLRFPGKGQQPGQPSPP